MQLGGESDKSINTYSINDKKVFFYCNPELTQLADFFANILRDEDKTSNILRADCTIQIGWGIYHIIEKDNVLQVTACDIENNPFEHTTDDLSVLLELFKQQCELIKQADVHPLETTLKNTMIVQKSALKQSRIYFQRQEPLDNEDSGWYMGAVDGAASDQPSDYVKAYTYQLFQVYRNALAIMQFPVGTIAIFENGELIEIVDGNNRKIW